MEFLKSLSSINITITDNKDSRKKKLVEQYQRDLSLKFAASLKYPIEDLKFGRKIKPKKVARLPLTRVSTMKSIVRPRRSLEDLQTPATGMSSSTSQNKVTFKRPIMSNKFIQEKLEQDQKQSVRQTSREIPVIRKNYKTKTSRRELTLNSRGLVVRNTAQASLSKNISQDKNRFLKISENFIQNEASKVLSINKTSCPDFPTKKIGTSMGTNIQILPKISKQKRQNLYKTTHSGRSRTRKFGEWMKN
ncbi:unnamed protein product [Moneuplotes crassus]|uniref:Uncharacterized protein n=1 Tax=Euplotes crassus TaxID=5936 RepID=A0AAD1XKJ3_EUPCR|nr:unnamed protein product [Moneuplotes crassus]